MGRMKACPFCGGRAKPERHIFFGAPDSFGVKCTKCSTASWPFYDTEEDALRAWNTRADAAAITNGVEKMQELYKMQGWEKTDVHFSLTDVERNLGIYDWEEGE